MMHRRSVLIGSAAATIGSVAGGAADAKSPYSDLGSLGFRPPVKDERLEPKGAGAVRPEDVASAVRVLAKGVGKARGIDVADYLCRNNTKSVTVIGGKNLLFREEWPTPGPSNPMIAGMFGLTELLPSDGDQTAWCAACVNYCLWAAGKIGTDSAASASFRGLIATPYKQGTPVTAKTGDIIVFKDAGPKGEKPKYNGHVTFFVDPADIGSFLADKAEIDLMTKHPEDYVYGLGGNQAGIGTGSIGGVRVATLPRNGRLILLGWLPTSNLKDIPT
jgi:hypothetical protein